MRNWIDPAQMKTNYFTYKYFKLILKMMKNIIFAIFISLMLFLPNSVEAVSYRTVYFRDTSYSDLASSQRQINRTGIGVVTKVTDVPPFTALYFIHDYKGGSVIHNLKVNDRICFFTGWIRGKRQNIRCFTITFASNRIIDKDPSTKALSVISTAYGDGKANTFMMTCFLNGRKVIGWR